MEGGGREGGEGGGGGGGDGGSDAGAIFKRTTLRHYCDGECNFTPFLFFLFSFF